MSIYDYHIKTSSGEDLALDAFKGQVILAVNTATQCGLTPQFSGLEKLHQDYKEKGLQVIGFPCNQFAGQEPLSNEEMAETCQLNHGVTFPLTEKIDVNGSNAHPIFKHLKKAKGGFLSSAIKWNFTKFLIDKEGKVVKRYAPTTKPEAIQGDIEKLL
jgi:glutathione peroxidase